MKQSCKSCGDLFFPRLSQVKRGLGKFCSRKCYGTWQKECGTRFDLAAFMKAHPEKVRQANEKKCGLPAWNKDKRLLYKTKGFKKGENCGEKHFNWKGGRWLYWRKKAMERDNFTCQHCGLREPEIMDVDHKIPIKISDRKKRDSWKNETIVLTRLENLQVLCPNCHKRKSNKDRKYWSSKIPSDQLGNSYCESRDNPQQADESRAVAETK